VHKLNVAPLVCVHCVIVTDRLLTVLA